jgi:hypothetical protein
MKVFLCASFDGTHAIMLGKHAYYPAEWIAREFPNAKDVVDNIQHLVRKHFA